MVGVATTGLCQKGDSWPKKYHLGCISCQEIYHLNRGRKRERERFVDFLIKSFGVHGTVILTDDPDVNGLRTSFEEMLIRFAVVTNKTRIIESQLPGKFQKNNPA